MIQNMIDLDVKLPLSDFVLEVKTRLDHPTTAVFGPSGAGKTSLLETIAGLRDGAVGKVEVRGKTLFSSEAGINLPPDKRGVGYVPQEGALFPHMSAGRNILYGQKRRESLEGGDGRQVLARVVKTLEIDTLLPRRPAELSGGERQRVALARALLSGPNLLLLDEPLAAVHVGLRERIIPYLKRIREEFALPILYVTHDPAEVIALADWVLLLEEGQVRASGSPREVLHSRARIERSVDGGLENILVGKVGESGSARGITTVVVAGVELKVTSSPHLEVLEAGTEVHLGIAAEEILLARKRPESISAQNVFEGEVEKIETMGGNVVVRIQAGEEYMVRVTTSAVEGMELRRGTKLFLIIKAHSIHVSL